MKTYFNSSNNSWSDIAIFAIITLIIAALFALFIAWGFQMSEQELQNMNTEARCKTAGGEMGYSKCFKETSMTKRELIQAIAAKAGLTNAQAEAALDAFGAVITEALVADKKIQLPGVFTASTTQRAERAAPPLPAKP